MKRKEEQDFFTKQCTFSLFYFTKSNWQTQHWQLTRIRLSSTMYSLSMLSRPSVDLRSLLTTNVLLAKRRNIDVLPTPYSPHKITFCSVTLTVAISSLSGAGYDHCWWIIVHVHDFLFNEATENQSPLLVLSNKRSKSTQGNCSVSLTHLRFFDKIRFIRRVLVQNERIWQKKVSLCSAKRDINHQSWRLFRLKNLSYRRHGYALSRTHALRPYAL